MLSAILCLATMPGAGIEASAQSFEITSITFDAGLELVIEHESDSQYYYLLFRGEQGTDISAAVGFALGGEGMGEFRDTTAGHPSFYVILRAPLSSPWTPTAMASSWRVAGSMS